VTEVEQAKRDAMKIDEMDFETALKGLNELAAALEVGGMSLEESVSAFETGVQLSRRCEVLLDGAEQRLKVLSGTDA